MIRNVERVLIILLLMITLPGCSNLSDEVSSSMEEKFRAVVPVTDLNESLEIKTYEDQKTFPLGSKIPILVENKSSHFLSFNYEDNYIKLFTTRDGKWVEVRNELTYSGSRILSPNSTPLLNLDTTWARPELNSNLSKDNQADILVRIVMTGEIMENEVRTGALVSAYVDVYINSPGPADSSK